MLTLKPEEQLLILFILSYEKYFSVWKGVVSMSLFSVVMELLQTGNSIRCMLPRMTAWCTKLDIHFVKTNIIIYFICDVPHLMKTTRNCWSNSFAH